MIELTAFKSIFDNKTNTRLTFPDWDAFVAALFKMSTIEAIKPKRGERPSKKTALLISPAVFKPNTTRANANVTHWSAWAALDIDEYEGDFKKVIKQFSDYSFVCYSSASSTYEHPKFRIVLRLTENIPARDIKHFWFAINSEFNSVGDPQTKDLSRMYYVPAQYPNAFNFIHEHAGPTIMDPKTIMAKHAYVTPSKDFLSNLPFEFQKAVVKHRARSLTNDQVKWTGYADCPFITKSLLQEYQSIAYRDGSGRYTMFYKIMINIAGNAIRKKYPITPSEIAQIMWEIDNDFGGRYSKRPLEVEAARAIDFILRSGK